MDLTNFIEHSEECLIDAKETFRIERNKASVSRSYYCIFHCIQALLATKQIFVKTHTGALNKFGELFVKTLIFDEKYSKFASDAFKDRQNADYNFHTSFDDAEIIDLIAHAEEFLDITKKYLKQNNLL
ncbi:MAG: HEPN domain-containing protein [Opitutaceae bacterium]|nr:HEPN domain-containing protein [Cytophagales bacterium]